MWVEAKEVALAFARNAARDGDLVQRGDGVGDIILDQSLRAEARFLVEPLVPHAVDIAVNAFVKDEEQPLDVTGGRQLAQLFKPRTDRLVIEIFALVGIAPRLQPRLTVMFARRFGPKGIVGRSEEHTSELQSLMPISYAVFCLKK